MPEPQFVRVRDRVTGDEYDVLETSIDPEAHEVVKSDQYPPSLQAREAKSRTDLAGKPAPKPAKEA